MYYFKTILTILGPQTWKIEHWIQSWNSFAKQFCLNSGIESKIVPNNDELDKTITISNIVHLSLEVWA